MTIEEVYTAIFKDDVDKVIEYLNSIPENTAIVRDKLDKLLAYAIARNRDEIVCILIAYNANPQTFNSINLFYSKEFGSLKLRNKLARGCDDCCDESN